MKAYVGVTDRDWYRFLLGRPDLDEVNFWQPSGGRAFRAIKPGDPFLQASLSGQRNRRRWDIRLVDYIPGLDHLGRVRREERGSNKDGDAYTHPPLPAFPSRA